MPSPNPAPTPAPNPDATQVADVTSALIDGTDCVMLSGESANGQYPVEAVDFMRGISDETERFVAEEGMAAEAAAASRSSPTTGSTRPRGRRVGEPRRLRRRHPLRLA